MINTCSPSVLVSFICMILLMGCSNDREREDRKIFLQKNAIDNWLANADNYNNPDYKSTFKAYYEKYVSANEIDSTRDLLTAYAIAITDLRQYDSLFLYTTESFLKKNKTPNVLYLYYSLGFQYRIAGNYEVSDSWFKKIIAESDTVTVRKELPNAYLQCGNVCYNKADYAGAVSNYLNAATYYEKLKDTVNVGISYANLANCYLELYSVDKYEKNMEIAVDMALKGNDKNMYFRYEIGYAYTELEVKKDTLAFLTRTDNLLNYFKREKILPYLAFDLNLLEADKYLVLKKIDSVQVYLDICKKLNKTINNAENKASIDILEARFLNAKDVSLPDEKKIADIALVLREDQQNYQALNLYEVLYQNALKNNQYEKALQYKIKKEAIKDEIYQKNMTGQVFELEEKYQSKVKDFQIREQAKKTRNLIAVILLLSAVMLAIVVLYALLKRQKDIVTKQNNVNKQLITIISHDIKEPLLGVKLLLKKLNIQDPFLTQASQSLENQITTTNNILNNLLKISISNTKPDRYILTKDTKSIIQEILNDLKLEWESKKITPVVEITDGYTLPIAPEKLRLILFNLIGNAIKYSFENNKILITEIKNGLYVKDFGVGMPEGYNKVLLKEVVHSRAGTKREPGNGLGLYLVGQLLENTKMKIEFQSDSNGTKAIIYF